MSVRLNETKKHVNMRNNKYRENINKGDIQKGLIFFEYPFL